MQHNPSDRRVLARIDDSVKVGTASVQVFSLGRTFTLSDRSISASLCKSITWSQQQLDLQLAPGESTVRDVTLSSSSNVSNAVIEPSPEIASFLTIQPASFVSLPAGQPQAVRLSFSIPQATVLKVYEGTTRVKTGGCNLQQTLKITVNVGDNSNFRALPEVRPSSGIVPLTVTFITRALYTGGGIIRYRWDFEGDGIFDTSDPSARNYTRTFTRKGIFNAVLEVTNDRNQITTASATITVEGRPPTATASVNPSNGASPLTVNLTGSGTDADGTIVKYEWDFEGDGTFDFTSSTSGNTTHVYNSAGTFHAKFRVTDNDGLTGTAQVTATAIRVGPPGSPTATITSPANPVTNNAPFTVSFNGTGSDPDGKIVRYEWDFDGNGVYDFSSNTSAATSFRYESPGTFTAALRVTDNSGLTGVDTIDITVNIIVNLTLPNETCRPLQGGTITVNSTQGGTTPITIFIRNAAGQTVRTIVNSVLRTAGSYSDAWDCKDANGAVVPEGGYFAILQYVANGQTRILDESTTTGGVLFNPDWTMSTSQGATCFNCLFKPLENDFLKVDFNLTRAAEVSVSVRLLSVADNDGGLNFTYDKLNRLIQARTTATAVQPSSTISYTYDADGNMVSMVDPQGGVTSFSYDVLDRPVSITNPAGHVTTYSYDALSRRSQVSHHNGTTTSLSYDAASRVNSILNHSSGTPLSRFDYTYDKVGNRATVAELAGTSTYQYDLLDRLTRGTHSAPANPDESFMYDSMGNRVSSHLSSSYSYDAANRLLSDDFFTYSYDANGNIVQKREKSSGRVTGFIYDAEDQLVRINYPNGSFSSYRYDALGRRIEKNVNGQITRIIYDREDILLELDSSNLVNVRYTHGPGLDEPLSMNQSGQTFFFQTDAMGSISTVSNTTGSVSKSYSYDSFGNIIAQAGSLNVRYAYAGREFDSESGLFYYRARYYDANAGRFLHEDPISYKDLLNLRNSFSHFDPELVDLYDLPDLSQDFLRESQSWNFYSYSGNRPTVISDPYGLWWSAAAQVAIRYGRPVAAAALRYGKQAWQWARKNVQFDGPSKGFIQKGQGRICQIRYKQDKVKLRLDYEKMKGSKSNLTRLGHSK